MTTLGSTLVPIDDNHVEGNENVQLTANITAGTGSFTPTGSRSIAIIQDNDGERYHDIAIIIIIKFFYLPVAVLTIGFEPITYQVTEAMGAIEVCFEVEENNVLDVTGQAILDTLSGSANGINDNIAFVLQLSSILISCTSPT